MKTILITGANGGIGLACAEAFLAQEPDARVFLGCRQHRDRAEALAAGIPDRTTVLTLDVTDPASWEAATEEILTATGRIDVLIKEL